MRLKAPEKGGNEKSWLVAVWRQTLKGAMLNYGRENV